MCWRRLQVHLDENGWPVHDGEFDIKAGQTVTLTTRLDVATSASVLPLTYDKFNEMAQKGDTIYVGRYLVSGADTASLYLEVQDVVGEDVICLAKNDALLTGLLTCFHVERSQDSLANVQNAQPLLSDYDKEAFQ
ncbi:pyruvate kinase, partial [Haematococcus lacustris]